jgi:5-methylcytosine-specific restriction protein A
MARSSSIAETNAAKHSAPQTSAPVRGVGRRTHDRPFAPQTPSTRRHVWDGQRPSRQSKFVHDPLCSPGEVGHDAAMRGSFKPPRPCSAPGCPTQTANARCETHGHAHQREVDARRGTSAERGYDATWRRLRLAKLSNDPVCQIRTHCQGAVATEVDHRIPIRQRPEGRLDWDNLQSGCKPCHSAKILRESAGRGTGTRSQSPGSAGGRPARWHLRKSAKLEIGADRGAVLRSSGVSNRGWRGRFSTEPIVCSGLITLREAPAHT